MSNSTPNLMSRKSVSVSSILFILTSLPGFTKDLYVLDKAFFIPSAGKSCCKSL